MIPNPDQPDRCPSIDPFGDIQCGRRIHDDDHCRLGGIGWIKGTPRYVSPEERLDRIRALAAEHAECSGCPTPPWLTAALAEDKD